MRLKNGDLLSDVFLEFTRRCRECAFCPAQAEVAHHWPTKGSLGYQDDTRVIPVCIRCHRRAHGTVVTVDGERLRVITKAEQYGAVDSNLRVFVMAASSEDWTRFTSDREVWLAQRMGVPMVVRR